MEQFIQQVLAAAREAGITAAEIYLSSGDSFRAMCQQGQVNNYTVNSTRGLSLRGLYQGKMGYAATEAFDDEAVAQLVRGVKESAALIEDEDVQEIYPGDAEYPALDQYNPALDQVPEARKLQFVLDLEKCAKEKDPRIVQLTYDMLSTTSGQTRIANSYGLNLSFRDNLAVAVASALAKEGDRCPPAPALPSPGILRPSAWKKSPARRWRRRCSCFMPPPCPAEPTAPLFIPGACPICWAYFPMCFPPKTPRRA